MAPKINEEIRQALQQQPGKPLEVEDDQTHAKYVVIPAEAFQKVQALFYDDSEFDPSERIPFLTKRSAGRTAGMRRVWKRTTITTPTDPRHDGHSR